MSSSDFEHPIRVPWEEIIGWAKEQRRHEIDTGQPVKLTEQELKAMSYFVSFNDEPMLEDTNYISLLMEFLQSRGSEAPRFEDAEPVRVPIQGHFESRWRYKCCVNGIWFPQEGYGIKMGQQAPAFQSKKNAKQYAAKYAFESITTRTPTAIPAKRDWSGGPHVTPARRETCDASPSIDSELMQNAMMLGIGMPTFKIKQYP